MQQQHFTAWISVTSNVLSNEFCDVEVLEDEVHGYRLDSEGNEIPQWSSNGTGPVYSALLGVRHDEEDIYDRAIEEVEDKLDKAGWSVEGDWEAVDTGWTATVERN